MKKLVFFTVLISLFLSSCASSKLATQEKNEFVGVFTDNLMKDFNLDKQLSGRQFMSDTSQAIVLTPATESKKTSSLLSDGTTSLATEPLKVVRFPKGTYGAVKEVVLSKDKKKVLGLRISFDSSNPDLSLFFAPDEDEEGSYVLYTKIDDTIDYGGINYMIESGKGSNLYFVYFFMEGQPSEHTVTGMKVKIKEKK